MMFVLRNNTITYLFHTIKIENFTFFGISSLISWANTFKNREFRPKIENFHHHSKFFMMLILRNNTYTSLFQTIKIENFHFFGISSLILWANTFKNREFRPKIENFHHHSKFFMMFILRNNNYYLSLSYHYNLKF